MKRYIVPVALLSCLLTAPIVNASSSELTPKLLAVGTEGCTSAAVDKSMPANIKHYEAGHGVVVKKGGKAYLAIKTALTNHFKPLCKCITKYMFKHYSLDTMSHMTPNEKTKLSRAAWSACNK